MTTKSFHVPVVATRSPKARYKACIGFDNGGQNEIVCWVQITAPTHKDAYRRLCAAFRPDDRRKIGCKKALRYYEVAELPGTAELEIV